VLYERIADGDFEGACQLILPETREAAAAAGGNCETALSQLYTDEKREEFRDVKVEPMRLSATVTLPSCQSGR
jgi:hypothetical protein